MARLALNKASLSQQMRQLRTFERYLPSLDLKRRQLMAERRREQAAMNRTLQQTVPQRPAVDEEVLVLGVAAVQGPRSFPCWRTGKSSCRPWSG